MSPPLPSASPGPLQRMLSALLRFVLVIGGMLLMLGAMMLALMLAAGVVLWALLRGRRPEPVNLHWGTMPRPPGFGRRPAGEVVDVQAVEVQAVQEQAVEEQAVEEQAVDVQPREAGGPHPR